MNDLLAMARAHKQIGAAARSHSEKKWEWRLAPVESCSQEPGAIASRRA